MNLAMWFNQAKCDIYMGTGAGAKLLKEIGNAQHSVKISSPYLSPKMVDKLILLHKQGVNVSLITSDTIYGQNGRQEKSIKPLIVQNKSVDLKAERTRNRWILLQSIFRYGGLLLLVLFVMLFISTKNSSYLFSLAFPMILFSISWHLNRKIRTKKIYDYTYSQLFPFRVFVTPDSNGINNMFIHGKIYIIDGHTAYLGSLNFTESGTKYNYETRVRVTDIEAVKKINEEFEALYDHPDLVFFGIEEWGKSIYAEPINQSSSELRVTFS